MSDEVAMVVAGLDGGENVALIKHGEPKQLRVWWNENREKYRPLFGELTMVTFPSKFPAEEINTILERPTLLRQAESLGRSTLT